MTNCCMCNREIEEYDSVFCEAGQRYICHECSDNPDLGYDCAIMYYTGECCNKEDDPE